MLKKYQKYLVYATCQRTSFFKIATKENLGTCQENPNIKEGNIDKHCAKDELFH